MDINKTLEERGKIHGDFDKNATTAQTLKMILRAGVNWPTLLNVQKEAIEMIAFKLSRIVNGDPHSIDSWHDIIGYAKLVEDALIDDEFESKLYKGFSE
jgi:hypothetical protein